MATATKDSKIVLVMDDVEAFTLRDLLRGLYFKGRGPGYYALDRIEIALRDAGVGETDDRTFEGDVTVPDSGDK